MPDSANPLSDWKALLTPAQLSELLLVTIKCLATWRCKGLGPAFIKVGGRVMYPEDRVRSWLAENEARSTAQAQSKAKLIKQQENGGIWNR
jgi:hypothetical protein